MDIVLVTLTIVSVAAAVAFGWLAWRLRDEERRRSEARVAALATAIDGVEPALVATDRRGEFAEDPAQLFSARPAASASGAPAIKLAVGAAMAIVLVIALAMSNRGTPVDAAPGDSDAQATPARGSAPLELVSMRHEREGTTLRVHGLVRNPRSGATMTHVSAVVFAFNRSGVFVTSGRAGLDFVTLEHGEESPFVVTIPGVADVGRYRVSFRAGDRAVQHVDRRAEQMRLAAGVE